MVNVQKAVKPDFFRLFGLPTKQEITQTASAPTDEEQMLYGLSQTAGWNIIVKYIDELKSDMDKMNDKAIESGAGYEEIGKNTLVINLAKGVINRIVNKVNDAKEVCERGSAT